MEDTLGEGVPALTTSPTLTVLILVLMEDTLGVMKSNIVYVAIIVLILVLMEDTLGG